MVHVMWDEHGFKSLQWFYWISTELSVHVFTAYGTISEKAKVCMQQYVIKSQNMEYANVIDHIKTGLLSVECISRYYSICMGQKQGK